MIVKLLFQPESEPLCCSVNVRNVIARQGGEAVFGWLVMDRGWYVQRQAHCVWRDSNGDLWDVTPYFGDRGNYVEFMDIEFELDPEATISEGEERTVHEVTTVSGCPLTKYESKSDNRHLKKALVYLAISDEKLHGLDLVGAKYWTKRANIEAKKGGSREYWTVPDSLTTEGYLSAL